MILFLKNACSDCKYKIYKKVKITLANIIYQKESNAYIVKDNEKFATLNQLT